MKISVLESALRPARSRFEAKARRRPSSLVEGWKFPCAAREDGSPARVSVIWTTGAASARKISELPSGLRPAGSSLLAKATREPSCETAGAGAREAASCCCVNVGADTFAETKRKPGGPPSVAAVVSKTTRRPSPLSDGLRLSVACGVKVTRRSDGFCAPVPARRPEAGSAAPTARTSRKSLV
jgi:hypothetical protein